MSGLRSGRFSNSNHQGRASLFHSRRNTGFSNARRPGYSYQARFSSPNLAWTHNQQEPEYLPTFDNTATISQEIPQFPSSRPLLKSFITTFTSRGRGKTTISSTITSVRPVRPKNLNQPQNAGFEQYQLSSWAAAPRASVASSGVPANPSLPEPSAQLLAYIPSNVNSFNDNAYRGANETLEFGIQNRSNSNPWLDNATSHQPFSTAPLLSEPVLEPEINRIPFVENNMHPFGSDSFTPPMGHSTQFAGQGDLFSAPIRFPFEVPSSAFEPPFNAGEFYQNASPIPPFLPPSLPPPPLQCPPQQLPPPPLPPLPPPPQPMGPFDHRSSEDFIYSEPRFTNQPPFIAAGKPHSLTGDCGDPSFLVRRGPPTFNVNDIAAPYSALSDSQTGFHDSSWFQYHQQPHEPQPVPPPSLQPPGPPVPQFQTPLPPNPPTNHPYRDTFEPREPYSYAGAPAFRQDERKPVDQSWFSMPPQQWPIGQVAPPPLGPEPESKRLRFAAEEAAARFLAPNPNPGPSPFMPDRVHLHSPPAPVLWPMQMPMPMPMPVPMPRVDFEAAAPPAFFRAPQFEEYGGEGMPQDPPPAPPVSPPPSLPRFIRDLGIQTEASRARALVRTH